MVVQEIGGDEANLAQWQKGGYKVQNMQPGEKNRSSEKLLYTETKGVVKWYGREKSMCNRFIPV